MKPRKRINPMSARRRQEMKVYLEKRRQLFRGHPHCQACPIRGLEKSRWSKDCHHLRGRAGSLFLDERFFLAVCRQCHDFIRDNIAEARKLGLVAEIGKWNNPR